MNIPTPCVCILFLSPVASLVASPTPTSPRRVAVVGAGIGGLALARALQTLDTGVEEVAVFDRRSELKPGVGGGIQINGGAAVLARLGLGEQMKASALPVRRILSRKSGGFELLDIDVESLVSAEPALVAPDGTPQAFSIMRDALQRILADSLPVGTVRLGQRLESLREDDAGVELLFEGGAAERFDLVVGADGATPHSAAPLTAPHIAPWHSARLCATTPQNRNHPRNHPATTLQSHRRPLVARARARRGEPRRGGRRRRDAAGVQRHPRPVWRGACGRGEARRLRGRVSPVVWRGRVCSHGLVRHRRGRRRDVGHGRRRVCRPRRRLDRCAASAGPPVLDSSHQRAAQ